MNTQKHNVHKSDEDRVAASVTTAGEPVGSLRPSSLEILEAFALILSAELVLKLRGLSVLLHRIRCFPVSPRETPEALTVERTCQALNRATIYYPKHTICLQRSAALTRLLRARGIPARLVIGFTVFPCKGHAWVEVNGRGINERYFTGDYKVLVKC